MPLRRPLESHRLTGRTLAFAFAFIAGGCAGSTLAVVSTQDEGNAPRSRIVRPSTPSGRAEGRLLAAALELAKSGGTQRPHTEAVARLLAEDKRFRALIRTPDGRERVYLLSGEWLLEERADAALAWRGDMREAVRIVEMILPPSSPR